MTPITTMADVSEWDRLTFKEHGIRTTHKLLQRLSRHHSRQAFAQTANIDQQILLRFANQADLMRIKGLGATYITLLREVGVNTVRDLRVRNPRKLHIKMLNANVRLQIAFFPPVLAFVERWIEQAKELPLVITYS